jgi:triphosphoribosyl-dephospho-CoA synthase
VSDRPAADDRAGATRSPAENAQLALLLEVSATPKPGNVDRHRDLEGLRFEHFLAGAVGASAGLHRAAAGEAVGGAFERAVAGMATQRGGNTQFGCLLLLVPLVRAAASTSLTPAGVRRVLEATTVADAVAFYRAFEHVDVAVGDPPAGADALDVRRGADAAATLRERALTLADVMALSAEREGIPDGNAREWATGFERSFSAAEAILAADGPVLDRIARVFLDALAADPDSHIAVAHGEAVAREVSERAAAVAADVAADELDADAVEAFAEECVAAGYNPGATADRIAAATFIALQRGLEV